MAMSFLINLCGWEVQIPKSNRDDWIVVKSSITVAQVRSVINSAISELNDGGPLPSDLLMERVASELDGRGEAHLIALACSPVPEGHDLWTLRLLAGKAVELGLAPSLSQETVRLQLKKLLSSCGGSSNGAFRR